MINDTISDMLTRIRNANLAKHETVSIINTKTNQRISEILKKQGYIESVKISLNPLDLIEIKLKYNGNLKKTLYNKFKTFKFTRPSCLF